MKQSHFPFILKIEELQLPVHLGVTEMERLAAQTVFAWAEIRFPAAPAAVAQDDASYLCYDTLCQALLKKAAEKPYNLVEHLAGALLKELRLRVPAETSLYLKLTKPLPFSLVGYDVKGASIVLEDQAP